MSSSPSAGSCADAESANSIFSVSLGQQHTVALVEWRVLGAVRRAAEEEAASECADQDADLHPASTPGSWSSPGCISNEWGAGTLESAGGRHPAGAGSHGTTRQGREAKSRAKHRAKRAPLLHPALEANSQRETAAGTAAGVRSPTGAERPSVTECTGKGHSDDDTATQQPTLLCRTGGGSRKPRNPKPQTGKGRLQAQLQAFAMSRTHTTMDLTDLTAAERFRVHKVAEILGLEHQSFGEGEARYVRVSKAAVLEPLPSLLGKSTCPLHTAPEDGDDARNPHSHHDGGHPVSAPQPSATSADNRQTSKERLCAQLLAFLESNATQLELLDLTSAERWRVHKISEALGLQHELFGGESARLLRLTKTHPVEYTPSVLFEILACSVIGHDKPGARRKGHGVTHGRREKPWQRGKSDGVKRGGGGGVGRCFQSKRIEKEEEEEGEEDEEEEEKEDEDEEEEEEEEGLLTNNE